MNKTIRFPGSTSFHSSDSVMFLCETHLREVFDGYWNNKQFTVCLRERGDTKRPGIDALKVNISRSFVNAGIKYERYDGSFIEQVLTYSADEVIRHHKLQGKKYWAWLEPDE